MKFFHWLYANINGYFWLDCPVCGEKFGGHQTKLGGVRVTEQGHGWIFGKCVCDKCTENGLADNKYGLRLSA